MPRAYDIDNYLTACLGIKDAKLRNRIKEVLRVRMVKRNEYIARSGDKIQTLAFVTHGVIKYVSIDADGTTVVHGICSERVGPAIEQDYHFGVTTHHTMDIIAVTDCTLMVADLTGIQRIMAETPELYPIIIEIYSNCFRLYADIHRIFVEYHNNLAGLFKYYAENKPLIVANASVSDLASFWGVSMYQLYRVRRKLSVENPGMIANLSKYKL